MQSDNNTICDSRQMLEKGLSEISPENLKFKIVAVIL